jgi:TetR/AcrR family transcriptional regulator, transcriptional repressor for nem operon
MACFREHGFDATSVRDLEHATGLKATSIYNAFGSKAGLFDAVLDRYLKDVVDRRISEHLRPELGLLGIRSFFDSTHTIEKLPSHGCLLTNTAIEFASIDDHAQRAVKRGLNTIRNAFRAQLQAARDVGQVGDNVNIEGAADALLVFYEGMLAMLRTGQSMNLDLGRAVDTTLRLLSPSIRKEDHDLNKRSHRHP